MAERRVDGEDGVLVFGESDWWVPLVNNDWVWDVAKVLLLVVAGGDDGDDGDDG